MQAAGALIEQMSRWDHGLCPSTRQNPSTIIKNQTKNMYAGRAPPSGEQHMLTAPASSVAH